MDHKQFDIERIVSTLKQFLPDYLEEKGYDISKNFHCINPEHKDDTPSCSLIRTDPSNPRCYCFGEGKYWDILDAVNILEGKPLNGPKWVEDTLKYLCEKYHVEMFQKELTEEQIYENDTYRAYKVAANLIKTSNFNEKDPKHKHVIAELKKRKWSEDILVQENIGIVDDYLEFRKGLKDAGFSASFLDEIDLSRKDIFNNENLIFTWKDEKGNPVGFTARNLLFEKQKAEAEKRGEKCETHKYNNQRTTGLKCNIFQKSRRLYGIDKAIKSTPPLYIFEGQADVTTARQVGLMNCVCVAGSSLSTDHILLLKQLGIYDLILVFDSDEIGQKKQEEILEKKLAGHRDLKVRVAILPQGEDPDSFIRKNGLDSFKELALWTAFEWRLNRIAESVEPTDICKVMIPFIVNESSAIEREQMCKILALRTGVSLKAIAEELDSLINIKLYEQSKERQEILERLQYTIGKNPLEAESILKDSIDSLTELSKKYDGDSFSIETFIQALDTQKEIEDNRSLEYNGFQLGEDLRPLQDALYGEWSQDVLMLFGGRENVGKCQSEDSLVLLSDGSYKKIKDVVKDRDKNIIKMNNNHKLVQGEIGDWYDSGYLDCYRIEADGIFTEPSETHPYYTLEGWKQVKDLKAGDKIAIAANYSCFDNLENPLSSEELIVLAGFLSEGGLSNSAKITNTEDEIRDLFKKSCLKIYPEAHFNEYKDDITVTSGTHKGIQGRNKILNFLKKYELIGKNAHEKEIPNDVFKCSKKQIAKFLGMFYACDGWVCSEEDNKNIEIGISLCNLKMITQIRSLLLRFGIRTTIHYSTSAYEKDGKRFDRYSLIIKNITDSIKFYNNIRIPLGKKRKKLFTAIKDVDKIKSQYTDNFPKELWTLIEIEANKKGISFASLLKIIDPMRLLVTYDEAKDRFKTLARYSPNKNGGLNRRILLTCGYILDNPYFVSLANGDIAFVEITKKEYIGKRHCYDLTVNEDHNFICNDMIVHNTSWLCKIAYEIAVNNNDALVIYHTIDDTKEQLLPRFICIAEGSKKLTIGQVQQPKFWANMSREYALLAGIQAKRERGYKKIRDLVVNRNLLIKDMNDGMSTVYMDSLIGYHQDKNPDRKIIFILDNFHKTEDFASAKDERVKFKKLSKAIKGLAEKHHIPVLSTVEYTKLPLGVKPTNHNIAESVGISYDANFIAHIYSEVCDLPSSYTVCHKDYNWRGEQIVLPRNEIYIGKNKISDFKGTFYLDFWPASSDYRWVSQEDVAREQEEMKEERKQTKNNDDPFKGAYDKKK